MIEQIALNIDAAKGTFSFERVPFPDVIGPVDYAVERSQKSDSFILGKGLFAGSILPGGNRLIFAGRSPVWGGFYLSTMGGAALVFDRLGIEFVAIDNRAPNLSVLILRRHHGEVQVSLEAIDAHTIWAGGYEGEIGFYALQKAIFDRYKDQFEECRILATGPAALHTNMGAIGSDPIKKGELTHVDTWAGRGGMGSKLVQQHGIVAIIYGGDYDEPDNWRDRSAIDGHFIERFDRTLIKTDREATTKYRYDEAVDSGGTFGVNYSKLKDWMLSFNYRSIFWTDEERVALSDRLVKAHYLKQFNEETIEQKQFATCGEPCPAVCKKMRGKFKKDYEPYQALGPLCGIFDQRAAERLNRYGDAMGFDAIQIGAMVAWLMELIYEGLISPEDLGAPDVPKFDPDNFDPVADSEHNEKIAFALIDFILSEKAGALQQSLRVGAQELSEKYNIPADDYAAYTAFGESGSMAPNQYWAPGLFAPMPIMGKYFQYYKTAFVPPKELGQKCAERMIYELYSDNNGMCRFHRGWIEKILQDLVRKHYKVEIDFYEHHKRLADKIHAQNQPVPWHTRRTIDFIHQYLKKVEDTHPEAAKWKERFDQDSQKAALEYWQEILDGINGKQIA